MEIFSGDFKDIFYDEEAEKRKEKRKERRDELQKAKIPNDYSPNQREINWFLVSSKVGCLFYQAGIHGPHTGPNWSESVRFFNFLSSGSGPCYQFFTGLDLDNDIFRPVSGSIIFIKSRLDWSKFWIETFDFKYFYGFLLSNLVK